MIRDVTQAMISVLADVPVAAWNGYVDKGADVPRVVIYPDVPGPSEMTLGGSFTREGIVKTTCVGVTAEQAEWAAEKTFAALANRRLPLPNGQALCSFLSSTPLARDDSVTTEVFWFTTISWAIVIA